MMIDPDYEVPPAAPMLHHFRVEVIVSGTDRIEAFERLKRWAKGFDFPALGHGYRLGELRIDDAEMENWRPKR